MSHQQKRKTIPTRVAYAKDISSEYGLDVLKVQIERWNREIPASVVDEHVKPPFRNPFDLFFECRNACRRIYVESQGSDSQRGEGANGICLTSRSENLKAILVENPC